MKQASLAVRVLALLLASLAGAAAAAPPCLSSILADDGRNRGLADEACQDDCCEDEDVCDADCDGCDCCPLRAPATVSSAAARTPLSTLRALDTETTGRPAARSLDEVFRPPRRSA